MSNYISDSILYIGVNDYDLDLFESQYVVPNGVSYNSYVIMDDKIAIMDTADKRATDEWLRNLDDALAGAEPDYLVIQHMEPDHSANIKRVFDKYPSIKLVGNVKTFTMLGQFFDGDFADRQIVVKDGSQLELGKHTLTFVMAPMIHWPEVMISYESSEKVLFSADAFGKFGTTDTKEPWTCEARRYYFNIVGKYGAQVQTLLDKLADIEVHTICPLHGPILGTNVSYFIDKYLCWSSYRPEDKGVFVACASIHGNTKQACLELVKELEERGETVEFADLTRDDMAEALENAFRYDRMIMACCTYDGGIFPAGEDFLNHLKAKNFQNRTIGIIENGSWAPMSGKIMKNAFDKMKNISILEPVVTIKSTPNEAAKEQIAALIEAITE